MVDLERKLYFREYSFKYYDGQKAEKVYFPAIILQYYVFTFDSTIIHVC